MFGGGILDVGVAPIVKHTYTDGFTSLGDDWVTMNGLLRPTTANNRIAYSQTVAGAAGVFYNKIMTSDLDVSLFGNSATASAVYINLRICNPDALNYVTTNGYTVRYEVDAAGTVTLKLFKGTVQKITWTGGYQVYVRGMRVTKVGGLLTLYGTFSALTANPVVWFDITTWTDTSPIITPGYVGIHLTSARAVCSYYTDNFYASDI